jgi:hypothetical protein
MPGHHSILEQTCPGWDVFWQEKKTSIIQKDVKGKRDEERYTPYRPQ